MELKDFISQSLSEIAEGVMTANKDFCEKINRQTRNVFCLERSNGDDKNNKGYVLFDIAVTVSQESEKSGGGKVKVAVIDFGGGMDSKTIHESVSRIKFQVKFNVAIL